jgi:hypothetical protein
MNKLFYALAIVGVLCLSSFSDSSFDSQNDSPVEHANVLVIHSTDVTMVNLFDGSFYDAPEFVSVVESQPVNSEVFKTYNVKKCGTDSNGDHYCCYFDGCCRVVCRAE